MLSGVEDIKADLLSPSLRLIVKLLTFGFFLWTTPNVIPSSIGIPGIDYLLSHAWIAWGLCTLFCVGFINAFNMADGANGLIPGVVTIAFGIFF